MGLPFSKPSYVKASKRAIINAYVIDAVGLAADTVFGVVIDDKVALEQIHPTYSLALLPLRDSIRVAYADALLYADCLAYEHEIPTLVLPRPESFTRAGVEFLLNKRQRKATQEMYGHELCVALEAVNTLRFGPLGYVEFRHGMPKLPVAPPVPLIRLHYRREYAPTAKEIHLYSVALRQLDPLSEYLCFYRVIESASNGDGEQWLAENLQRLEFTEFGILRAGVSGEGARVRKRNLYTILRRRALARLEELFRKGMSWRGIAKRFYRTNRVGIAHGHKIRWLDFATDFREVYLDCFALRLMARLAIQDKLKAVRGGT